jgi:hypothetical protein
VGSARPPTAPPRTIPHESHRESPAPTSHAPHPTSLDTKPQHRAPTFALKGPLPDDPLKLWEMVIGACATQHRMRMLVGNMKLLKVDNDLALLQVAEELRPTAASAQQELSALLSTAWGQTVRVEIESLSPAPPRAVPSGESPAAQSAPTPASQPAGSDIRLPTSDIASHPLIKQAIDLFGARVIGVQPRRKQAE